VNVPWWRRLWYWLNPRAEVLAQLRRATDTWKAVETEAHGQLYEMKRDRIKKIDATLNRLDETD
jgi:hypothetical protein